MTNADSLWWFGHLEKMNEDQIAKPIYGERVNGSRGRGRLRKSQMELMRSSKRENREV